jgi:cation transport regulator ChaC
MKYFVQVMELHDDGNTHVHAWEVPSHISSAVLRELRRRDVNVAEPEMEAIVPADNVYAMADEAEAQSVVLRNPRGD